jgi:hypothetical protein
MFPQARALFSKLAKKLNPCREASRLTILTALRDLVNPGKCGLAPLQVFLVRVDVSLLRERRVVVTGPLADDRDRHACVLTMSVRVVWRESCRVILRSPAA